MKFSNLRKQFRACHLRHSLIDEEQRNRSSTLLQLARRVKGLSCRTGFQGSEIGTVMCAQITLDSRKHLRIVVHAHYHWFCHSDVLSPVMLYELQCRNSYWLRDPICMNELPSIHSSSIPGLFRCKYAPAIHLRRVRGCMILPDYQKVPGINERSRRAVREKGSGGNSRKRKPQSTPGAKRKVTALKRPKWCMGVPEDWRKNRQRKRPRDHLESMLYQRGSRRSYGISAICASGAFELIMKSGSIRRN